MPSNSLQTPDNEQPNMTNMTSPSDTPVPTPHNSDESNDKKDAAPAPVPKKKDEENNEDKKDKSKSDMQQLVDNLGEFVSNTNDEITNFIGDKANKGIGAIRDALKGEPSENTGSMPKMTAPPDTNTSPSNVANSAPTATPKPTSGEDSSTSPDLSSKINAQP